MELIRDGRCVREMWNVEVHAGAADIGRGGSPALYGRVKGTLSPLVIDVDGRTHPGWLVGRFGPCGQVVLAESDDKGSFYAYLRVDGGFAVARRQDSDIGLVGGWMTTRVGLVQRDLGAWSELGFDTLSSPVVGEPVHLDSRAGFGVSWRGIGLVAHVDWGRTVASTGWVSYETAGASLVYVVGGPFHFDSNRKSPGR